jgi:hypothetical protein
MNVMRYSRRQNQERTRWQIMGLSLGAHFQPTLQDLDRHDAFGTVLRQRSALLKQEQRDRKAPVPVKRLLPMIAVFRQWLREQRRRNFVQIDLELRRMKAIFRMLPHTFVLVAHDLLPIWWTIIFIQSSAFGSNH